MRKKLYIKYNNYFKSIKSIDLYIEVPYLDNNYQSNNNNLVFLKSLF